MKKLLVWIITIVLILLLLSSSFLLRGKARYSIRPNRTKIEIKESDGTSFLSKSEVWKVLPFKEKDTTLCYVDLHTLEQKIIAEIPYIAEVNAYVSPLAEVLHLEIEAREPILKYYIGGDTYFLDSNGASVRSRLGTAAYVPIAVGQISEETIKKQLYPLALYLKENKSWHYFFSLIDIDASGKIHLYPRIGQYLFEIVTLDDLDGQFDKIAIFYNKIVPQVGADKYRLIKLSYKGQIVCQYR